MAVPSYKKAVPKPIVQKVENTIPEEHGKESRADVGALILRIGIGLALVITGAIKLIAPADFAQSVQDLAIVPFSATAFAYFVGIAELALGILLFIGFITRVISIVTAAFFLAALVFTFVYVDKTFMNLGLTAASVALAMLGPGNLSVDNLLRREQ